MYHKKPRPTILPKSATTCPVCGKLSYSSAGIHPQCSMERESREMRLAAKAEALAAEQASALVLPDGS